MRALSCSVLLLSSLALASSLQHQPGVLPGRRQDLSPSEIPSQCVNDCTLILDAFQTCGSIQCLCTAADQTSILSCVTCLEAVNATTTADGQQLLTQYNKQCGTSLTASAPSSTATGSTSTSGLTSGAPTGSSSSSSTGKTTSSGSSGTATTGPSIRALAPDSDCPPAPPVAARLRLQARLRAVLELLDSDAM
ncbi:hypothetical protein HMN09_00782500 [Mycena chlorophos]|uniref:Extracellular membrane protein CFEM domain-containing protein n=1 Tax=Mycena chlorophos TaxID=658473 RepID=A0A8H6W4E6_MYCCL|nr:hypothetical protein HMN09_00782500 [Mycena chlorophos]